MLSPGATIGILGGGQLGRMMAMAAAQLGYRCHIYSPEEKAVAADVAAFYTCAGWYDAGEMARFAQSCDIVTWEFENVPVPPLAAIPAARLACDPRALEVAQDRLTEKRFFSGLGGRTAPFMEVDTPEDLVRARERIGTPAILKTRRNGYDGKGQWRIEFDQDLEGVNAHQGGLIYEGFVHFSAEFSVILARGTDGQVKFWDSPENVHRQGILDTSTLPAPELVASQVEEARALAQEAARELHYVGVMTLEFFATENGPVFNEMAPRVHNSGHWTIEGAETSQFENHIRAICGLPLGSTATIGKRVEMRNLIGPDALEAGQLLADPASHLHLYGKSEARAGRKMGHVTKVAR